MDEWSAKWKQSMRRAMRTMRDIAQPFLSLAHRTFLAFCIVTTVFYQTVQ